MNAIMVIVFLGKLYFLHSVRKLRLKFQHNILYILCISNTLDVYTLYIHLINLARVAQKRLDMHHIVM